MFPLSVKDIKDILEIEGTEQDTYIEKMLPVVIAVTEKYCESTFALKDEVGFYVKTSEGYILNELGVFLPIAKTIEYFMNTSGISQSSISRISQSFTTDIPKSVTTVLNNYRKVKFI